MTPRDCAYIALGVAIGVGAVIYQSSPAPAGLCETYRVAHVPVTSYVMKQPPAPDPVIIKEACPKVEQAAVDDEQPDLSAGDDVLKMRRHHRRHWRHRRYWR